MASVLCRLLGWLGRAACLGLAAILALVIAASAALAGAIDQQQTASIAPGPTAEEYIAKVGRGATIVESGYLVLAGHRVTCGVRPTVLDPGLYDYAAAYDGFLIINPVKLQDVPPPVALWIYSHECGHQFRGPDEELADCFAVQRGRRQGWLTPDGVEQICNFITPSKGDFLHFSGPRRCETVRRCYGSSENY
jgi:hypothetical protein